MLHILVTRADLENEHKITSAEVVASDHSRTIDVESRWDWKTFEAARKVAAALGEGYIATDSGKWVSPRYDVIALPKVGDKASYAFNGDCSPCGEIASISKSLKVIRTTDGRAFYRVRLSGSWRCGGTWSLVAGHHYERNPSF